MIEYICTLVVVNSLQTLKLAEGCVYVCVFLIFQENSHDLCLSAVTQYTAGKRQGVNE